jgi:predicted RNA-binding protein with PUA-like domain
MRIKMTIEVEVEDDLFSLKNEEERKWLENELLIGDGSLILHSNEIGDLVGIIKKVTNLQYLSLRFL